MIFIADVLLSLHTPVTAIATTTTTTTTANTTSTSNITTATATATTAAAAAAAATAPSISDVKVVSVPDVLEQTDPSETVVNKPTPLPTGVP